MKIIRSINIEKEVWDDLEKIASAKGRSMSNLIEKLIKEEKERMENENKKSA